MKRYPILEVCARVDGHADQYQLLRELCQGFDDWADLLEQAEREGMAPLLKKHLLESGSQFPATVRRSLHLLYKRHQKNGEVRIRVIEELFRLFRFITEMST